MSRQHYEPVQELTNGGDNSCAGTVCHDGLIWMSYRSSHEKCTSVCLVKTRLDGHGSEQEVSLPPAQVSRFADDFRVGDVKLLSTSGSTRTTRYAGT